MSYIATVRVTFVAAAAMSLSACLGGGGGGAAGGGGGGGAGGAGSPANSAAFQTNYDRVTSVAPSSDVPTQITATYVGAVRANILEGTSQVGEMLADLELALDWTDTPAANETNVWSGSMRNLRGTFDDEDFTADGQLNVLPARSAIQRQETTIALPGLPTVTTATAGMQIEMAGVVTIDGDSLNAGALLGGNCFDVACRAIAGTVGGTITDTLITPDYTLSGQFYAER